MLHYRLHLEPDDNDTILVTSPDLPLVTFGEDRKSAVEHAVDAAHVLLAGMMDDREDIPPSGPEDGSLVLPLPFQTQLKVALYIAMREAGMTRADLQRRLGWQRESVDRLFRLDHRSRIEQIEEAFRALGKIVAPAVSNAPAAA